MKRISFPLQQGDLDYLCSVYAVINLLNVTGKIDTIDEAVEAFETIIAAIDNHPKGSLATCVMEGVLREDIPWFAKLLDCELRRTKGKQVKDLLEAADPGAIIHFRRQSDELEHYTVVRPSSENPELSLFDSYGFKSITHDEGQGAFIIDGEIVEILDLFVLK